MVIGGGGCYMSLSSLLEFGYSTMDIRIYQKDKIMTPKELYDWAVENGAEDYDLRVATFQPGRGERLDDLDERYLNKYDEREQIIFDV